MSDFDSLYLTGAQQVSIYPYQTLSSVYGNELLHGLFDPGVYSSNITLSDGSSNTIFRVNINTGTTLLFKRQHTNPDDPTKTDIVIGKIVITSPNFIDILKADLWQNIGSYAAATKLYIVADWHYGITSSSERYVKFTLETDLSAIQALDGTTSHKLIIASLSNHQWFITNYSATNPDLYNYHISYEYQLNRDPLTRLYRLNENFPLIFAHNGRSVTLGAGSAWISNSLYSISTPVSIPPAVGLTHYIENAVTHRLIPIAGSESLYYQIDFLRLKVNEVTQATTYGWDSFLVTGTGSGSTNGSSLGWSDNSITKEDLLNYIKQFVYPLSGKGYILLVSVRPRSSIPTVDGSTNILWPEHCVIFRDQSILSTQSSYTNTRLQIPVWDSTDLGY